VSTLVPECPACLQEISDEYSRGYKPTPSGPVRASVAPKGGAPQSSGQDSLKEQVR
jgi:hypothetical protein